MNTFFSSLKTYDSYYKKLKKYSFFEAVSLDSKPSLFSKNDLIK